MLVEVVDDIKNRADDSDGVVLTNLPFVRMWSKSSPAVASSKGR